MLTIINEAWQILQKTSILYIISEVIMPQLSLYIDEKTLKNLETAAKMEHTSISKYVVKKINESMHSTWPGYFEKLFGSISDESFSKWNEPDGNEDIPREEL